ncbi:hypothetical protein ABBQ32_007027 [Trebouxia sp. C0010 RCD-2024]
MGMMSNGSHVNLLKGYKDDCGASAPPPAVLDDGEVECTIEKVLAHCDTTTGRRSYYVQRRGLPPEDSERSTASKLRNAADVVQDFSHGLSSKSRPAARVGRRVGTIAQAIQDTANADNIVQAPASSSAPTEPKRRRGRLQKADFVHSNAVQRRGRRRPRKQH